MVWVWTVRKGEAASRAHSCLCTWILRRKTKEEEIIFIVHVKISLRTSEHRCCYCSLSVLLFWCYQWFFFSSPPNFQTYFISVDINANGQNWGLDKMYELFELGCIQLKFCFWPDGGQFFVSVNSIRQHWTTIWTNQPKNVFFLSRPYWPNVDVVVSDGCWGRSWGRSRGRSIG